MGNGFYYLAAFMEGLMSDSDDPKFSSEQSLKNPLDSFLDDDNTPNALLLFDDD